MRGLSTDVIYVFIMINPSAIERPEIVCDMAWYALIADDGLYELTYVPCTSYPDAVATCISLGYTADDVRPGRAPR